MFYYLYIDEENDVGAGRIYEEDMEVAKKEIEELIRQATDLNYICFTSQKRDFLEELKEYENTQDYLDDILEGWLSDENDYSADMGNSNADMASEII